MTYVFDNNLAPQLAKILGLLDVDAWHVRDLYDADPGDVVLLRRIGQEGWTLVSCDRHMRTRGAEIAAIREHHVTSVFFVEGFGQKLPWDQALWLLKHWRDLDRAVTSAAPGAQFRALGRGRVERVRG